MPGLRSRGPRLHCLPGARNSHCEFRPCGIPRPFAPTLPTVQTARPPRREPESCTIVSFLRPCLHRSQYSARRHQDPDEEGRPRCHADAPYARPRDVNGMRARGSSRCILTSMFKRVLMAAALGALPLVAQINPSLLAGLQWRNVGPFRAGRAGAVCGVPGQLGVYYFGAMQGGFWKSTSSGHVWTNITDKTVPEVAGISVCAVAGANPDEVFFSSNARGPGMFRSTDGGSSWQHVGPIATAILIDPKNANLVIVGRTGAEGGVFRSTDGGVTFRRSWAPPAGGVASLQWAYDNPSVIYATSRGAGGRGGFGGGAGGRGAPPAPPVLYRSGDEGQSFEAISPQGLPALGPFSVSGRTNSQR